MLRYSLEDQSYLLGVGSDGHIPFDKLSISADIPAPTVLIGSANPTSKSLQLNTTGKLNLDTDLSGLKPLLDRFPYKFVIPKEFDKKKNVQFAGKKYDLYEEIEDGNDTAVDYSNLLAKYVMIAKTYKPKLSSQAKFILSHAFANTQVETTGSPRVADSLYNMAKALAKAKFKNVIEAVDAIEVVADYQAMIAEYGQKIEDPENPDQLSFEAALSAIQNSKNPNNSSQYVSIKRSDLVRVIGVQNEKIDLYLRYTATGLEKPLTLHSNKPLRTLHERLVAHPNILLVDETSYLWADNITTTVTTTTSAATTDEKVNEKTQDKSSISNDKNYWCDRVTRDPPISENNFSIAQGSMTSVDNNSSLNGVKGNENIEESNRTLGQNENENQKYLGHRSQGHTNDSLTNEDNSITEEENDSNNQQPIRYGNSEEPLDLEELKKQAARSRI